MIKPEVLDAMVEAGCTPAQIVAAVKADQAHSSGAARQARYRARKASQGDASDGSDVTSVTVTSRDDEKSPDKENPQTPKEINPKNITPSPPLGGSVPAEFDQFWKLYPHKVGKADAKAKFAKALKRADFETIMDGLQRYASKTDDRPWCNPATWLHQDRWGDEPAQQPRGQPPPTRGRFDEAIERMFGADDDGRDQDQSQDYRQPLKLVSREPER